MKNKEIIFTVLFALGLCTTLQSSQAATSESRSIETIRTPEGPVKPMSEAQHIKSHMHYLCHQHLSLKHKDSDVSKACEALGSCSPDQCG